MLILQYSGWPMASIPDARLFRAREIAKTISAGVLLVPVLQDLVDVTLGVGNNPYCIKL